MKKYIKQKLRESLIKEEEYFTPKLSDDIKRLSHKYVGRNVTWYGDPDQMIVVNKDQVEGMWGNIYSPEKMEYLVDLIRGSDENVELECSFGIGFTINLTDVIEEQTSYNDGTFDTDYEQKDEPATTGDEEYDKYLGYDEYISDEFYVSSYEVIEFFKENKLSIIKSKKTSKQLLDEFKQLDTNADDYETFNEFINIENGIKQAIENGDGDLGKFMVQLREGHHRVMAAIESGEQYVCLNLAKDDINKFKGYYDKV